jgi:hypothetical protein
MLQGFPEGDGERVFLVREVVSDNTPPWSEVVGRGAYMHLAFLLRGPCVLLLGGILAPKHTRIYTHPEVFEKGELQ